MSLSRVVLGVCIVLSGCAEQPTHILDGDGGSTSNGTGANHEGGFGGAAASGGQPAAGGEGGSGGVPQTATFSVLLSASKPTLELRSTTTLDVLVPANGYIGTVSVAVTGLPPDVTAALVSDTVDLVGDGVASDTLTLTTASDTVTGEFPFQVTVTAPEGAHDTMASVVVEPVITVYIPANLSSYSSDPPNTTAFGDYPTRIKALPNMSAANPITVNFFNGDTVPHEIHADQGALGFGHGNQDIPPGSFDPVVRHVSGPGTFDFYPHDFASPSVVGRIIIE
ncbi:MAG: hypothetical protein U0271_13460 [Polyangiaceae bacterium]